MKVDALIRKALDESPVPYEIIKAKDHYFAQFSTGQRVLIAGNHGRQKWVEIKVTVRKIKKITTNAA